jgi:hypothetical protein
MACCVNRRSMVYYTFHDIELMLDMEEMFRFLQVNEVTVAQLWNYITSFKEKYNFNLFYHHIREQYQIEKDLEGVFDSEELQEDTRKVEAVEKVTETREENLSDSEVRLNDSDDKALEKPTKRMKIVENPREDKHPSIKIIKEQEGESSKQEDTATAEDDIKNRKITDYFCKVTE